VLAIGKLDSNDRYETQVPAGVLIEKSTSPKLVFAVRLEAAFDWLDAYGAKLAATPL